MHSRNKQTNQNPLSKTVKRRKLSIFGHVIRLPDDVPAKLALNEYRNPRAKKSRGGQKLTWLKVKPLDIDLSRS